MSAREDLDACTTRVTCPANVHLSDCPLNPGSRTTVGLLGQLQGAVDRARADRQDPKISGAEDEARVPSFREPAGVAPVTAEPSAPESADVEVLLAHHVTYAAKRHRGDPWKYDGTYMCQCGDEFQAGRGMGSASTAHLGHVAAVVADLIARVKGQEAERIASAIEVEWHNGNVTNSAFERIEAIARIEGGA